MCTHHAKRTQRASVERYANGPATTQDIGTVLPHVHGVYNAEVVNKEVLHVALGRPRLSRM